MNKYIAVLGMIILTKSVVLAQNDVIELKIQKSRKTEAIADSSNHKVTLKPVSINDFKVRVPGESAIYLINNGRTDILLGPNGWGYKTKYFLRIKILESAGLDLADFKIKYLAEKEEISELKVRTLNYDYDLSEIKADYLYPNEIYEAEVSEGWNEISFAAPQVKVNSILEVTYIKSSPFVSKLDDWFFQKEYPVKRSLYSLTAPSHYAYKFLLRGIQEIGVEEIPGFPFNEWFWLMEDVPGFQEEPFLASKRDNLSSLISQLESVTVGPISETFLKSWKDVTGDLQESKLFKAYYNGRRSFSSFQLPGAASSRLAYAKAIYRKFSSQFKWNKNYGVFPDLRPKEIIRNRSGNAPALGLTLFQVLKEAGFEVQPVVFSPRKNGKLIKSDPYIDRLKALVVRLNLNGEIYLLDPIHDVPFGFLDKEFLNGEGLILGDSVSWQDLTINAHEEKTGRVKVHISEDSLFVDLDYSMEGYASLNDYHEILSNSLWDLSQVEVEENEINEKHIKASISDGIDEENLFLPVAFDNLIFEKNPFEEEERQYPIDFYFKKNFMYTYIVDLSDDYEFEFVPDNQTIRTQDGRLYADFNVNNLGQRLEIQFQFRTSETTFLVEEYPVVKSAYKLMEKLKGLEILISRKTQ